MFMPVASGILADVLMAVGAILLATGWGNRRVVPSRTGRRALVIGLGMAWFLNRCLIGMFGIRANAGGLVLMVLATAILLSSPLGLRGWIRQIAGMVLTTATMAVLWAGMPYTPLVTWPLRDLVCAGIGAAVAGLVAPSSLFAAACAGWGVVGGIYEVLMVQYDVVLRDIVWFDTDLVDEMMAAGWIALAIHLAVEGLLHGAGRRPGTVDGSP